MAPINSSETAMARVCIPDSVVSRLLRASQDEQCAGFGWLVASCCPESERHRILSSISASINSRDSTTKEQLVEEIQQVEVLIPGGMQIRGAFFAAGFPGRNVVVQALLDGRVRKQQECDVCTSSQPSVVVATVSPLPAQQTHELHPRTVTWSLVTDAFGTLSETPLEADVIAGKEGSSAWQHPLVENFWKERCVVKCDFPVKLPLYLSPHYCKAQGLACTVTEFEQREGQQ